MCRALFVCWLAVCVHFCYLLVCLYPILQCGSMIYRLILKFSCISWLCPCVSAYTYNTDIKARLFAFIFQKRFLWNKIIYQQGQAQTQQLSVAVESWTQTETFILILSWCFSITIIIQQTLFINFNKNFKEQRKNSEDETANKIKNHALLTRQHMRVVFMSKHKINSRQLWYIFLRLLLCHVMLPYYHTIR